LKRYFEIFVTNILSIFWRTAALKNTKYCTSEKKTQSYVESQVKNILKLCKTYGKNEFRYIYCSSKLILFLQIAMLEIIFDFDLVMKIYRFVLNIALTLVNSVSLRKST